MATYYNISDYGIKYVKEFMNETGNPCTLTIYQKGYTGLQYEIAKLRGVVFQIQGNDSIDSPMVKTSLQITLVDDMFSPGVLQDGTKCVGQTLYRCGNWVEFYTPDSTKYLVVLKYNDGTFWRGYITPDSYSESLDAFGDVVITVRDNIGHLQDFDFDLAGGSDGLVKVTDLITQAFTKIAFPMDLSTYQIEEDTDHPYLVSEDGNYQLTDLYFNAAAMEGETYYDVLEAVLNSLGLCLRYCDRERFKIMPLRAMPYCGYDEKEASDMFSQEFQFYGRGSGTRTFDPAYKQIVENVNFEQEDDFSPDILCAKAGTKQKASASFVNLSYVENPTTPSGGRVYRTFTAASQTTGPCVNGSSTPSDLQGWAHVPIVNILDDGAYSLQDYTSEVEGQSMHNYLFLVANWGTYNTTSGEISWVTANQYFTRKIRTTQIDVDVTFAKHPAGFDKNGKLGVYYSHVLQVIIYEVYYQSSDRKETRYWNGTRWQVGKTDAELSYNIETTDGDIDTLTISLTECEELGANGYLTINFLNIEYVAIDCDWKNVASEWYGNYTPVAIEAYGIYARLKGITFTSNNIKKKASSDTVTTICNASHNVRCERNPTLGFIPVDVEFVDPLNYKNAFFVYDANGNSQLAPYRWRWSWDQTVLPFPVKIHQQLLMFHYTTEEILEGYCGLLNTERRSGASIYFDAKNIYKGKTYLLKSCTFDVMEDRFTSAQFRSFKYYADLWDGSETYSDDKLS
jgi:hypothetical protein